MKLLFLIGVSVFSIVLLAQEQVITDSKDWNVIEIRPIWIGCEIDNTVNADKCTEEKIMQFIEDNLENPAGNLNFKGKVFLTFVINKEGYVNEVTVLKGLHKTLDKAAVDVISKLPKFFPGTFQGHPIDVKLTVPIKFY